MRRYKVEKDGGHWNVWLLAGYSWRGAFRDYDLALARAFRFAQWQEPCANPLFVRQENFCIRCGFRSGERGHASKST